MIILLTSLHFFQLTSEEVVKSFIARIKEINPILNCMVDQRFEAALQDAKAADELIRWDSVILRGEECDNGRRIERVRTYGVYMSRLTVTKRSMTGGDEKIN